MTSQAEVQALLRFLAQDAKLPLALAMRKVKDLQTANLTTASAIAAAKLPAIRQLFASGDDDSDGQGDKLAKQVHNAAKRVGKRKATDAGDQPVSKPKKAKTNAPLPPADYEASLALPEASGDIASIEKTVLVTNRAPLVLAFAVTLLKYTMPEQPLSSRLSLAQAQVSANARSKAVSLGLDKTTPLDEAWTKGQTGVRVMGREIKTMKRWGYDPTSTEAGSATANGTDDMDEPTRDNPPLWGLDVEALQQPRRAAAALPIHTPESARAYLLKSFAANDAPKATAREREASLGLLLGAIEQLYTSWRPHLSNAELDARAWQWYVAVRPAVAHGPAGWGGKGEVRLEAILALRHG